MAIKFKPSIEKPLLNPKNGGIGSGDLPELDDDAAAVTSVSDAWKAFSRESKKLWAITVPIGFSILCLYGINSASQIFAGHLGNLQLSAVAIGLSVISNFSFGFLVSPFFPKNYLELNLFVRSV